MTWADIKETCQVIYPQYVGDGNLIDDSNGDENSATSLALLIHLVHSRIVGYPYEFDFLKQDATITITGATSYDLSTEIPGFKSLYQVYGITENQASEYYSNAKANITPCSGYTIKGNVITFTGSVPTSGTLMLQIKSSYMVKSSSGDRKKYFLADDDISVLNDADINVLIFGVGEFINWGADVAERDRKEEVRGWFTEARNNILLHNNQTNQVESML